MPCPADPASTGLVYMMQPCSEPYQQPLVNPFLKWLHPSFLHTKLRSPSHFIYLFHVFIQPFHGFRKPLQRLRKESSMYSCRQAEVRGSSPTGRSAVVSLPFSTRESQELHRSKTEEIVRLSNAEPPYVTAQIVSLHVLEKTTSQLIFPRKYDFPGLLQGLALLKLHSYNRHTGCCASECRTRSVCIQGPICSISHNWIQELQCFYLYCHTQGNVFILCHGQACLKKDIVIIITQLFFCSPSLELNSASYQTLRTETLGHLSPGFSPVCLLPIHTEQLTTKVLQVSKHKA